MLKSKKLTTNASQLNFLLYDQYILFNVLEVKVVMALT